MAPLGYATSITAPARNGLLSAQSAKVSSEHGVLNNVPTAGLTGTQRRKEELGHAAERNRHRNVYLRSCRCAGENSSYCGKSSLMSCHGALEPTKMWQEGFTP